MFCYQEFYLFFVRLSNSIAKLPVPTLKNTAHKVLKFFNGLNSLAWRSDSKALLLLQKTFLRIFHSNCYFFEFWSRIADQPKYKFFMRYKRKPLRKNEICLLHLHLKYCLIKLWPEREIVELKDAIWTAALTTTVPKNWQNVTNKPSRRTETQQNSITHFPKTHASIN